MRSFDFEGLRCFADPPSLHRFWYAPLHADLQRSDNKTILTRLLRLDSDGFLIFTAVWTAEDAAVEGLAGELARRTHLARLTDLDLLSAPAKVARCDTVLRNAVGGFDVLGSSPTSGLPPFSATFQIRLNEAQLQRVDRALGGEPDTLLVRYDVRLRLPHEVRATLVPTSADAARRFGDALADGVADPRQAVVDAIAAGWLAFTIDLSVMDGADQQETDRIRSQGYEQVLDQAAMVARYSSAAPGAATAFAVSTHIRGESTYTLRPQFDFATS